MDNRPSMENKRPVFSKHRVQEQGGVPYVCVHMCVPACMSTVSAGPPACRSHLSAGMSLKCDTPMCGCIPRHRTQDCVGFRLCGVVLSRSALAFIERL